VFKYFNGSSESFRDELQQTLANLNKANSLLTTSKQGIKDQKNIGSKNLRRALGILDISYSNRRDLKSMSDESSIL